MIKFKSGVYVADRLRRPIAKAINVAHAIYQLHGQDLTITSLADRPANYKKRTLHTKDLAVDFRIRNMPKIFNQPIAQRIESELGPEYDVMLKEDHIHVEYDPK